jgi:hypothetical protein
LKRKRRKNKIMLEVLNVEMLWQRAIRWKGMYVKKKKKKKKNRYYLIIVPLYSVCANYVQ